MKNYTSYLVQNNTEWSKFLDQCEKDMIRITAKNIAIRDKGRRTQDAKAKINANVNNAAS